MQTLPLPALDDDTLWPMRPWLFLPAILALASAACAQDAASIGREPAQLASSRADAPQPADDPEEPAGSEPLPWVVGSVVDDAGQAVVGRNVTIVDRRGATKSVLTDDGGAFGFADVAAPYDLAVEPAPSGDVIVPTAFLGVRRRDPRLALPEHDAWVASASQTLRMRVALPPCPSASCWVTVASASPSGSSQATRAYGPGDEDAAFDLEHAWRREPEADPESVDVHVLAGDDARSAFAYAVVAGIAAAPGEITDLGTIVPAPIAATEPVTVSAQAPALPSSWGREIGVALELPGGATVPFSSAGAPALVTRLPRIAGAALSATAVAERPPVEGRPELVRAARAWSGRVDLGATQVLLDLPAPPSIVRPRDGGTLSLRGRGLRWEPGARSTTVLDLRDVARAGRDVRVVTGGDSVTFGRLERLGVAAPELGAHVLDVSVRSALSLDDALGEDAAAGAGAEGRARLAVTITR
jgi:hypothetical protein